MSGNDFEYGGRSFKLNKLDAFKQFHIVRRIGPILSDLLPAMKGLPQGVENLPTEGKLDVVAKFAGPIMAGFSKLSDVDAELVLHGLLSCVEMKGPGGAWVKVSTSSMLMVQDLELPALLNIAGRSFMFNLSGFFSALPVK